MTTIDSSKIVRIVDFVDTREYEEVDDRWVPIRGSGNLRPCDRCGREHEVHVTVELADGRTATVGSGCARGESAEVTKAIRSGEAAAKRRARIVRELDAARRTLVRALEVSDRVSRLTPPAPVLVKREIRSDGELKFEIWRSGDATVYVHGRGGGLDDERRRALDSSWRSLRYHEIVGDRFPDRDRARREVDRLEDDLARADRSLAAARLLGRRS